MTTLAGSVTLIGTSSNLLIAGIAVAAGVGMNMLSFAAVALPVALVGFAVIYLTAPRMLRGKPTTDEPTQNWRVEIPISAAALAQGRTAAQSGLVTNREFTIEEIRARGPHHRRDRTDRCRGPLSFHGDRSGDHGVVEEPAVRHRAAASVRGLRRVR